MKRRYERTTTGGWGVVLIPETQEDLDEIEQSIARGEVDGSSSFGDRRAEVQEDDEEDAGEEGAV